MPVAASGEWLYSHPHGYIGPVWVRVQAAADRSGEMHEMSVIWGRWQFDWHGVIGEGNARSFVHEAKPNDTYPVRIQVLVDPPAVVTFGLGSLADAESTEGQWYSRSATARGSSRRFKIALSFAGEQRGYVEAVADALHAAGIRPLFYDGWYEPELMGQDLVAYLEGVYGERSDCVAAFISKEYVHKPFPGHEQRSAQAHALLRQRRNVPFILPLRFDGTKVPGLRPRSDIRTCGGRLRGSGPGRSVPISEPLRRSAPCWPTCCVPAG